MRDHTKLRAFELADELAVLIYRVTRTFPKDEIYGLTSQMRIAAVSVPSNIVEGCARESQTEYLRFLEIAFGSLRELHYQYGLAQRLGYADDFAATECELKMLEAEKVLGALMRSMRSKKPKSLQPKQPQDLEDYHENLYL
jgi:four helix bundle protein